MRAALSLVWARPEHGGPDAPEGGDGNRTGNGHPEPSTILVVEDEVLVRLAIADHLRDCGYRVLEAKTGEEAQSVLRSGEPVEILFSDIDLGRGMDGFALARWTREHYRDIRIILTSGVRHVADDMREISDVPLLPKPYSYNNLAAQVSKLLGAMGRRSG
jgi:CheY-like chemotaxis protein